MIESKELRIGNYVNDADNDIMKIAEVFKEGCSFYGSNIKNLHQHITPIPLSEEILLKCGFEEVRDMPQGYRTWYNSVYIYWHKNDVGFYKFGQHSIKIYYLHELQNVYFSLKGKELNVEL